MSESKSKEPSVSVVPAKQGSSNLSESTWIDRTVWNDRLLAALGNGVKGKCPNKYFAEAGLLTMQEAWLNASQSRC